MGRFGLKFYLVAAFAGYGLAWASGICLAIIVTNWVVAVCVD